MIYHRSSLCYAGSAISRT